MALVSAETAKPVLYDFEKNGCQLELTPTAGASARQRAPIWGVESFLKNFQQDMQIRATCGRFYMDSPRSPK